MSCIPFVLCHLVPSRRASRPRFFSDLAHLAVFALSIDRFSFLGGIICACCGVMPSPLYIDLTRASHRGICLKGIRLRRSLPLPQTDTRKNPIGVGGGMGGQPCYTNQGNAFGYGHRQRGWRTVRQCSALGNPVLRTWVGTWTSARHLHYHCLSLAHPTRAVLWLHQGVLFFVSRCLTLTWSRRIMSPARSFYAIVNKQQERASGRNMRRAGFLLAFSVSKIMCGQVLKAVITMCIEINCDCVFGMITGRRLLKRVSNTPLLRFSLPRCVRIFSHNGLSPSYLLTLRRALRCIKSSYICVYIGAA